MKHSQTTNLFTLLFNIFSSLWSFLRKDKQTEGQQFQDPFYVHKQKNKPN